MTRQKFKFFFFLHFSKKEKKIIFKLTIKLIIKKIIFLILKKIYLFYSRIKKFIYIS
jgi:hypothetical protein